ncbi:gp101 [Sphingomonas phage PAU]|uniref:gp101 n=1 Tax=Sphingomonas phage PAU TaxID=1150991 RepID=UPI0002573258|nr:gp101 [Sphingomonas phage PAU]AFF28099.1 gp101 [Sphingomonas phage PAU]
MEIDFVSSSVTLGAVATFIWTQRSKILAAISRVLDIQMTKSLEKNSEILTEVYEYMNEILVDTSSKVTNVAIVKYHNGMDKLTIHSNIHKTMIHELCSKSDGALKDIIQDISVDSKTLESLLKLISNNNKEEGKVTLVDTDDFGLCQRIYSGKGIKRYYSYCIYRSTAYYLVVHIYTDSDEHIEMDDLTNMQVNSMKIGKLLTKR